MELTPTEQARKAVIDYINRMESVDAVAMKAVDFQVGNPGL